MSDTFDKYNVALSDVDRAKSSQDKARNAYQDALDGAKSDFDRCTSVIKVGDVFKIKLKNDRNTGVEILLFDAVTGINDKVTPAQVTINELVLEWNTNTCELISLSAEIKTVGFAYFNKTLPIYNTDSVAVGSYVDYSRLITAFMTGGK